VQLQQVLGLVRLQLRLLAAQPTLGLRYFHPVKLRSSAAADKSYRPPRTASSLLSTARPVRCVGRRPAARMALTGSPLIWPPSWN